MNIVDLIYREVDNLLRAGSFSQVDDLIRNVDPESNDWSLVELLAFVSITHAAKQHLQERRGLFERVRRYLESVDPSRVVELLDGLE
jgi:hypothetical protein